MNAFFSFCLKNRLWVHYFTLLIVLSGIYAAFSLRREARPEVNFDRVAVSVTFRGSSAEDIEQLIIKPLEEALEEIDGIEEYRSTAFEGIGSIAVKLDPDYPDKDDVITDITQEISQVSLPTDADDPVITEIKASKITVLSFALYGDLELFKLRAKADELKQQLQRVEGVSSIDMLGFDDLEFSIKTDLEALNRNSISLSEVMDKLRDWNSISPAGEVKTDQKVIPLRIDEQLTSIKDIENLVLRANDYGNVIRIKDIGKVILQTKETKEEILLEGNKAIFVSVVKKESEDIITVVKRIREFLDTYKKTLPKEIKLDVYYDDSASIQSKLKVVSFNALFGLFLVLVVLLIVLNWRVAVITSIGLPIAFLGGLAFLFWAGMTINTLVVLGMIVVLGMLVDDAIVVSENIYSHIERGLSPFDAALKGVTEVASPVMATVMTTIFAFLPIIFMKDIIGQFLSVIPVTVILILLFSLIEALTILPVHATEILKSEKEQPRKINFMSKIQDKYNKYVVWSLNNKRLVFIGLMLFMGLTIFSATKVKFVLFPSEGIQFMSLRVQFPQNTLLKTTSSKVAEISKAIKDELGKDVFSISSTIGQATFGGVNGTREQGSHIASSTISFADDPSFIYREQEVIKKVQKIAKSFNKPELGLKVSAQINRPGPPVGSPIEIMIASRDFDLGQKVADEIIQKANKVDGIFDMQTDLQDLNEQYQIKIIKERAIERGINLNTISSTVFTAFYGAKSSSTRIGNDEVDLVVTFKDEQRKLENLLSLKIPTPAGDYVPLRSIAKIETMKARGSIQRLNGARTITIFGDVKEEIITARQANAKLLPTIKEMQKKYPSAVIDIGGSEKDRINALKDTAKLYIFALVGIFMVISLSFNSIFFPFIVIFSIPFGLTGVVWALILHGKPLSMMGIIGVVGLSGVVVNGAIILVQFILEELRKGTGLKEAILVGVGRRLRPIVITTITTLVGLAPTIYSLGGKDPFIQPLALALGWGLFVATLLTLFCMPAIIYLMGRFINLDKLKE